MTVSVITVARQLGSGGDVLGRWLADRLNIPLLAQEVLQQVAQRTGVPLTTLEAAERVPSWRERLFEGLALAHLDVFDVGEATPNTLELMAGSGDYRRMIEEVVRGMAERGRCVIIGHAAQIALQDRDDVLRLFIHAPEPVRVERLVVERGIAHEQAMQAVQEDDRQRADFYRTYYNVRLDDPALYDLTLNTGSLDLETAGELVLLAVDRAGVPS